MVFLGSDSLLNTSFLDDHRQDHLRSSFGWWFGTFLVFHILECSSSQLTNSYFSEGWPNHQPVIHWSLVFQGRSSWIGILVNSSDQARGFTLKHRWISHTLKLPEASWARPGVSHHPPIGVDEHGIRVQVGWCWLPPCGGYQDWIRQKKYHLRCRALCGHEAYYGIPQLIQLAILKGNHRYPVDTLLEFGAQTAQTTYPPVKTNSLRWKIAHLVGWFTYEHIWKSCLCSILFCMFTRGFWNHRHHRNRQIC